MNKLIAVVGDIHGMLDEFDELLKMISYNKEKIRLISLGDVVHRGYDSLGCVRRLRELGVETCLGNHDEKHIRFRKHQAIEKDTGKINPMKMSEDQRKVDAQLTDDDMDWIKSLPITIPLDYQWIAAHAGAVPGISIKDQDPKQLIRVRYINDEGKSIPLKHENGQYVIPPKSKYWAELWQGPESIINGHMVHSLTDVYSIEPKEGVRCLGIDTGACFNGHLTTALMHDKGHKYEPEFVQVKAKQACAIYFKDRISNT